MKQVMKPKTETAKMTKSEYKNSMPIPGYNISSENKTFNSRKNPGPSFSLLNSSKSAIHI